MHRSLLLGRLMSATLLFLRVMSCKGLLLSSSIDSLCPDKLYPVKDVRHFLLLFCLGLPLRPEEFGKNRCHQGCGNCIDCVLAMSNQASDCCKHCICCLSELLLSALDWLHVCQGLAVDPVQFPGLVEPLLQVVHHFRITSGPIIACSQVLERTGSVTVSRR